jgi:FixJ family two-component response regulator
VHLPGVNGIDVYNRLVALESCLSSVIVTGVADLGATVRLANEGAIILFKNPYHSSDIIDAVKRGFARSQARWEER